MGAALTLMVLLAGSVFIVRIASVYLRLTGLPDNIARFQSISALTGSGFTTRESETIVNYPARRRVIVALMLLGNLGFISVVSTFIVALADTVESRAELLNQIMLLVGAAAIIGVLMLNKTFDRILCGLIEKLMLAVLNDPFRTYEVMLELPGGKVVARHRNHRDVPVQITDCELAEAGLTVLNISGESEESTLNPKETAICIGSSDQHSDLARSLALEPDQNTSK